MEHLIPRPQTNEDIKRLHRLGINYDMRHRSPHKATLVPDRFKVEHWIFPRNVDRTDMYAGYALISVVKAKKRVVFTTKTCHSWDGGYEEYIWDRELDVSKYRRISCEELGCS